jgi:flagellar protein FlbT
MGLKIEVKSGEKVIVGNSVITNHGQRARLSVEGQSPILRATDVMHPETADTPCKKIYLAVQTIYLSANPRDHFKLYFDLIRDVQQAAPSMAARLEQINNQILNGSTYKALKLAGKLINLEKDLMDNAKRT